jgi:DNA-binding YbaB/EbfC family protein
MGKGKGSSAFGKNMMAQVQELQAKLVQAQEDLGEQTVEVTTGGGAVRLVMSGTQECREVDIGPDLLEAGDIEMIQDLILLAINQAVSESQALAAKQLGPLAGGLGQLGGGA